MIFIQEYDDIENLVCNIVTILSRYNVANAYP